MTGLAALVDEIVGDGVFDAAIELASGFDGVEGRGGAEAIGYVRREGLLEGACGVGCYELREEGCAFDEEGG